MCPACASPDYHSTGPAAPPISASVGGGNFEQPAYRIRECARCGLLYRDCVLSAAEFERYYSLVPASKWELPGYYPTETAVLSELRKLPPRSRILDFGCSSGRLLSSLTAEYECYGIEINENAARAAAEKGLRMLPLEALDRPELRFEAIVLTDVFEHLSEPVVVLRKLAGVLAPDGALMIVTGNGDAKACRRDPAQFWYFRVIEHVCMLTRSHADFLASELRLRLVQWTGLCHYSLTVRERLVQKAQHFAYWQFRRRTWLARRALRFLPLLTRLQQADVGPAYTCSRDHVLAIFKRP